MTRQKKRRLEAIGDLITEYPSLGSQAELVDRLREIGIAATQSSISRDLQKLGILGGGSQPPNQGSAPDFGPAPSWPPPSTGEEKGSRIGRSATSPKPRG